jgi:hypothetical protein
MLASIKGVSLVELPDTYQSFDNMWGGKLWGKNMMARMQYVGGSMCAKDIHHEHCIGVRMPFVNT